jgi:DNA-binding NarL/FixJ family response regulator
MKDEITVIIADDHPILRRGLRQVIEGDAGLRVLAEADDGEQALKLIQELKPKVAVLDIDMPKLDGFGAARELRKRGIEIQTIFLTMHSEEDLFNEALELGALGYILKDSAIADIVAAIKAVAAGKSYVTASLTSYLLNRARKAETKAQSRSVLDELTPAERRILKLIAEYKTTKEIADQLFISNRTVDNHRANICQKLGVTGTNALLKFVVENKKEI